MKTFEEQYTAWVDGRLTGPEREEFERLLPDRPAAELDRAAVEKLGGLLRQYSTAPAMANADFFSHQLLERMEEGSGRAPVQAAPPRQRRFFFSLPQLAYAGLGCILLALGLFYMMVPDARLGRTASLPVTASHVADANPDSHSEPEPSVYDATIVEANPMEPGVTATSVYSKAENVTVLWLDGLEYLPASYSLQEN